MHIVVVTTFFPNSANPQRAIFVENLVRAMRETCLISVVSPVPIVPPLRQKPGWLAQSRIEYCERVRDIDVLHPRFIVIPKMNWWSGFGFFLGVLPVLRRLIKEHGRFLIHAHCAYPDGVGVALAARVLQLPYVITVHGSDINVYANSFLLKKQICLALRRALGVIAVSGDLQNKVKKLLGGGAAPALSIIPCAGFDSSSFYPRLSLDTRGPDDARLAVFVGRLIPVKAVDILIQAWASLCRQSNFSTSIKLIIIGEGELRRDLKKLATQVGIATRVHFVGAVPQSEVARWISKADILCLSSYSEGTPNVVVEALASGVPVVATRVGGIPELVQDGVNGFLIPPGDVTALADAINQGLSKVWNRTDIQQSVAHLTWRAIAARNCDFIQRVCSEGRHAPRY